MWPTLLIVVALLALAVLLLLDRYSRRSENWGASREEVSMALPGDDWLDGGPPVRVSMTRAVSIDAPPQQVWPWIAQLGRGAGWYSYDRLDNGGRPSASHIVGWIPEPRIGDAVPIGYLRHLEPEREVVWWIKRARFLGAVFRGVTLYRVTGEAARSRLVLRIQAGVDGSLARPACWLYRVIDGLMARRQLVGIKGRVERYGDRRADPELPESGERDQYQFYHAIYASGEEVGIRGKEHAAACRQHAIEDGVVEPVP